MRAPLIILLLLFLIAVSCMKEKEFPIEPIIEFKSMTKIVVSPDTLLRIGFTFTDGDGDIGLPKVDSLPPPPYDYNLFIMLYRLRNNVPEVVLFPDTIKFFGRIPIMAENPENKPIEGEINYDINYNLLRIFVLNDTIAFDIKIRDRALHESNVIRTPFLIAD